MKHGRLIFSLLLCSSIYSSIYSSKVYAESSPYFGTSQVDAVLQNPVAVISGVRSATNAIQPGAESIYDLHHHRWVYGTSMALWMLKSHSFPLASLRAGYAATGVTPYGEVQLDLPGLTSRFLPSTLQGTLSSGFLDGVWRAIGKYGLVGITAGFGFDQQATGTVHNGGVLIGVSLGAKLTF